MENKNEISSEEAGKLIQPTAWACQGLAQLCRSKDKFEVEARLTFFEGGVAGSNIPKSTFENILNNCSKSEHYVDLKTITSTQTFHPNNKRCTQYEKNKVEWISKIPIIRKDYVFPERMVGFAISASQEKPVKAPITNNNKALFIREKKTRTFERGNMHVFLSIVKQAANLEELELVAERYEVEVEIQKVEGSNEEVMGNLILEVMRLVGLKAPLSIRELNASRDISLPHWGGANFALLKAINQ